MPAGAFMLTSSSIPTITGITPVGPYELTPFKLPPELPTDQQLM